MIFKKIKIKSSEFKIEMCLFTVGSMAPTPKNDSEEKNHLKLIDLIYQLEIV